MPATRATRVLQALACLLPILLGGLPAAAAERSPPDIVLFKARLLSFHAAPEGNPRCDARFPARAGTIVLCGDTVSPMDVLDVLLGELPHPPQTVTLTMTSTPAKPIEVFITAKKLPDGSLHAFGWERSPCLGRADAGELGIAAELAGIYAARRVSCRGWND